MKTASILTIGLLAMATLASAQETKQLAFPGAEGFGRYATGGRAGSVYHVTNLNDSGTGSFRDAVSQPNRIVVFDVSGVIYLKSAVTFANNLTIAGQTAPGDGVTLYGGRISISGRNNIICRYLRVRYGANSEDGKDAIGISDASYNMIFDHMSVTWGRDENFSINSTSAYDITIQNSIIGQGLQNHSCGGLIQTSKEHGVTIYRNLYIDNKTRNPKVKGLNQFVNNVVYNWGSGAAYNMGGESEGESLTTIENNYLIKGPCVNYQNVGQDDGTIAYGLLVDMSPAKPFTGGNANFSTYFSGNFYDSNKDGELNGVELFDTNNADNNWLTYNSGSPTFLSAVPEAMPAIAGKTTAAEAYAWIKDSVGACLPIRDEVDDFLVGEMSSLGLSGTIIQNETNKQQFPLGGIGEVRVGSKLADTDGDGMPDIWEQANGTNPDADDAMVIASNGYANIENYINSIAEAQPFFPGPSVLNGDPSTESILLTWKDRSDKETGFQVEMLSGSDYVVLSTLPANTTSYEVKELVPGMSYSFRLKAFSETESSVYSDVLTISTKRVAALPNKCTVVAPANGSTISIQAAEKYMFEWANDVDEDSGDNKYSIYMGTSADDLQLVNANPISILYRYISIEADKTYFWRVDAVNAQGVTTGDVWSFTTKTLSEKEPVLYLSLDNNLKNTAPAALAAAEKGAAVDAVASVMTEAYEEGHLAQGLVFPNNGTASSQQGITVPYYEGLSFSGSSNTDPEASFTVSMWVKSNGNMPIDSKCYLFHKGAWSGSSPRWVASELRSGKLFFVYKVGSKKDELTVTSSPSTVFDGKWHHLAFVRSHEDGYLYAYIDGALAASKACTRDFMNLQCGITFGNSQEPATYDEPFAGSMDELKVFHGALSAAEISNVYSTGYTTGSAPAALRSVDGLVADVCVYPTAVFNSFFVEVPSASGNVAVSICGMSGVELFSTQLKAVGGRVEVSGFAGLLSPGLYVVKVATANGVASRMISIR